VELVVAREAARILDDGLLILHPDTWVVKDGELENENGFV
jgi:hypothetical protein